jgi:aspartyl/glutamyl-tRNA(Asn/Gln) amidotransferase C subunit
MDIQKEEVLKLAQLSMLRFTDQEVTVLTRDFKEFLGYVQEIMTVDVLPNSESNRRFNVFREDKVINKDREDILSQAPARSNDYFVVPKILEGTES